MTITGTQTNTLTYFRIYTISVLSIDTTQYHYKLLKKSAKFTLPFLQALEFYCQWTLKNLASLKISSYYNVASKQFTFTSNLLLFYIMNL